MSKVDFLNDVVEMTKEVSKNYTRDNIVYDAASQMIEREIDTAFKNQRISEKEAALYKSAARGIIYRSSREKLPQYASKLFNSTQENLLGMETLMGIPQRHFAPAFHNAIVGANSRYMDSSLEESRKYLQNIGVTKEYIENKMRRGDFKKEDLADKDIPELIASVADKDFVDPIDQLPYPFYTKDEKPKESKLKKYGNMAMGIFLGATMVSTGAAIHGFFEQGDAAYHFKDLANRVHDLDGGGIPNDWEDAHGLNKFNPADDKEDSDHNGYTNLEEYILGLDPNNPDCDHDGLLDGGDPDCDNITTWVERNIMHTNPLVPNDRYVILANSVYFDYGAISDLVLKSINSKLDSQYNFFHDKMKIPKENIIDLRHPGATLENFTKACNKISNISDENDFVYVILNGHGGNGLFSFDEGNSWKYWMYYDEIGKILDKIPSKAQYVQISSCHSESAIEQMSSNRNINSVPINISSFGISEKYEDFFDNISKEFQRPVTKRSPPRVIVTSSPQDKTTHWFPFIDSLYPSVISRPAKPYLKVFPFLKESTLFLSIPTKTTPDKNGNHFVSIKEAFQSSKEKQSLVNSPYRDLFLTSTPEISDPDDISDNFYFGEYLVRD
ncbi:MAG: hypothetical protein J7L08_02035 [Candidatus Aenigmarchaeota archaeon]|nr:hypothetical protein [Candidatus Aenigmarchaeota archaeon]